MSEQLEAQVKGLNAQLDATKQMLNESLAAQLQLRSSLVIFQQTIQEHMGTITNLKNDIAKLNEENAAHLARITELDAKCSFTGEPKNAIDKVA